MKNKPVNPLKPKNHDVPLWLVYQQNSSMGPSVACVLLSIQHEPPFTVWFYDEKLQSYLGYGVEFKTLCETSVICWFFKTKEAALARLSEMLTPPSYNVKTLLKWKKLFRLDPYAEGLPHDVQPQAGSS